MSDYDRGPAESITNVFLATITLSRIWMLQCLTAGVVRPEPLNAAVIDQLLMTTEKELPPAFCVPTMQQDNAELAHHLNDPEQRFGARLNCAVVGFLLMYQG